MGEANEGGKIYHGLTGLTVLATQMDLLNTWISRPTLARRKLPGLGLYNCLPNIPLLRWRGVTTRRGGDLASEVRVR